MRRLLHEPLLQFLVLGAALFAAYSYLQRNRGGNPSSNEIRLSLDDLAQIEILFESKWHRAPTAEEFNRLLEDRIREDILYREALSLGLDDEDTIVKRRMAQKMRFLSENMAAAREPTGGELRAWFSEHGDELALPPRIGLRHLYFSNDRRGEHAGDDAARALVRLAGQPQNSALAQSLADPFMFQEYYADATPAELAREFGPEFAQAVERLSPGSWQGPVESGYGWHLVFVDSVIPGRVPAFEEVEQEVKAAWLGERKAEAWREAYEKMRAKYRVLLPVPPDDATAAATDPVAPAGPLARENGTRP